MLNSSLWVRHKLSNFRVFDKEAEMIDIHNNTTFRPHFLLRRARVISNSYKKPIYVSKESKGWSNNMERDVNTTFRQANTSLFWVYLNCNVFFFFFFFFFYKIFIFTGNYMKWLRVVKTCKKGNAV